MCSNLRHDERDVQEAFGVRGMSHIMGNNSCIILLQIVFPLEAQECKISTLTHTYASGTFPTLLSNDSEEKCSRSSLMLLLESRHDLVSLF